MKPNVQDLTAHADDLKNITEIAPTPCVKFFHKTKKVIVNKYKRMFKDGSYNKN
jgi:hypothetical protein